jgi:hypothetical protein
LIDGVCSVIYQTDELRIFVPGSSLEKIHDACVSNIPQMDRIIAYFETEAEIKCYQRNSAEHINRKVQYCLTRNLHSILVGTEIRSILYQDGPIDQPAANDVLEEMRQRLARKEKAAKSVKLLLKSVHTVIFFLLVV